MAMQERLIGGVVSTEMLEELVSSVHDLTHVEVISLTQKNKQKQGWTKDELVNSSDSSLRGTRFTCERMGTHPEEVGHG